MLAAENGNAAAVQRLLGTGADKQRLSLMNEVNFTCALRLTFSVVTAALALPCRIRRTRSCWRQGRVTQRWSDCCWPLEQTSMRRAR
jgi:hypothetical protein